MHIQSLINELRKTNVDPQTIWKPTDQDNNQFILDHIPTLIKYLRDSHKLPVIVFSLSKGFCEKLLQSLISSEIELPKPGSSVDWPSLRFVRTQMLLDGLRNGIGVHHSAIKKEYRLEVEKLFRLGMIKVVIATGTLAMVRWEKQLQV